jgi:hypothetical protein
MKSRWISHKGVEIFYVDFSDFLLSRDLFEAELKAVSKTVSQKPEKSVKGLVDVRNTALSIAITVIIKGYARRIGRYIGKAAVIVDKNTEAKRILLSGIAGAGGREVVLFEDVEEAKDWLVENE